MKQNFSMKKKLKVEINLNSVVKLKRYHFGKIKALFDKPSYSETLLSSSVIM